MIDQLLQELKETWGYETEELNDIREKLEEVAHAAFWEGFNTKQEEYDSDHIHAFTSYGKREDFE
jgi:REP element-mobilizing transposase RayT